ncbi:5-formyltetrahydrofolate cyclo-ligase [Heliorestis convoluta]|uniref:5-formyltetrahydrofolate cyclo-ligase n=1 Tax=Heliorestis convoluta TaxID=356322 RepID=A0A5Q2N262_9FIRM|nr:5-formyltetrahydrofolate cyclo-ligase [Heliorestis convoluta]QGG49088.1 5-formyltetrahydrofolate cyclo-ligase [Heliorestis convoluta]
MSYIYDRKEDKAKLRAQILHQRKQMSLEEQEEKSKKITEIIVQSRLFYDAKVIMAYASFRQEVDTRELIDVTLQQGKRMVMPLCHPSEKAILPCEIKSQDDLVAGTWGILEPRKESLSLVAPTEIDLIFVPALAFDRQGHRLGYGAGYYDRFFTQIHDKTIKIGLAYQIQIVHKLLSEPHDIPVNHIVTEKGWIDCELGQSLAELGQRQKKIQKEGFAHESLL